MFGVTPVFIDWQLEINCASSHCRLFILSYCYQIFSFNMAYLLVKGYYWRDNTQAREACTVFLLPPLCTGQVSQKTLNPAKIRDVIQSDQVVAIQSITEGKNKKIAKKKNNKQQKSAVGIWPFSVKRYITVTE